MVDDTAMENERPGSNDMTKIVAVIIAFHPKAGELERLCERLLDQVEHMLVIDNTERKSEPEDFFNSRVTVYTLGSNLGIGAAQNLGVEKALAMGATHVLFLDQDSLPESGMVPLLLAAEKELLASGDHEPAAVGPQAKNREDGRMEDFIRLNRQLPGKEKDCDPGWFRTRYLHSTGTLVRAEVLRRVGPLDESLFIDMVDMEWCFRAADLNLATYGISNAVIHHHVGNKQKIGFGKFRRLVSIHPPLRTYYQVRNWFLMLRKKHVPTGWLIRFGLRNVLARFLVLALFTDRRIARCRCFFFGMVDGIMGVGGEYRRHY